MRTIAAEAGVDPALIHHYFKTKRALFDATLAVPDTGDAGIIAALGAPNRGEALVLAFLTAWDAPAGDSSFARLMRTAATEPATQTRLVELIAATIVAPAASAVDRVASLPKLRATLVAAQLAGIAWLRYVLRLEPVASASPQLLARTFGPSNATTFGGHERT
jgi:AcrR family transcriptional regulator